MYSTQIREDRIQNELLIKQQNIDKELAENNMTDQSDCNTSFQEQRQTEPPDNESNKQIKRQGKKNTIHQYYKIRTDRYLNELKQKQTSKDASSQIFPDSANESFQASNQDNSCNNSGIQITVEQKDFKRNDQRKPSTKQYYQKKVLGMIQDMSKRSTNYSYMKSEKQKIEEKETDSDVQLLKKNNQIAYNSNFKNISLQKEESYASDHEKVIQKHLEIMEKQKKQQKIQQELNEHQDQLVHKYHFLFDKKGLQSGLSKSASSGKITDKLNYSEEKIQIQSHQSSLVFHESSFKKFQQDKAQLLEKHKMYVEQMKKLEKEINSSSEKQNNKIQPSEQQDEYENQVKKDETIISYQENDIQQNNELNLDEVYPAVETINEDTINETQPLENQQIEQQGQENQENLIEHFEFYTIPQKQDNEEKKIIMPTAVSEADLQSSDLQLQISELKHRTTQKISAMKGNRRNQSQQRFAQGEKSVQFPFQEEQQEKERRKDLILDSDEGIKLDLSKLGAINKKDMKKKRADTQSANSKRSIKSNWSTKTFKEKAEEVAAPAFGTALIGSLGVAITNKVLKGKQKLLGIVPALALGAYLYYKAQKESEIQDDDGYEEDIDDNDIDSDDEVNSTNIKE